MSEFVLIQEFPLVLGLVLQLVFQFVLVLTLVLVLVLGLQDKGLTQIFVRPTQYNNKGNFHNKNKNHQNGVLMLYILNPNL